MATSLEQQAAELNWISVQMQHEIRALKTSDYPNVHRFLLNNLAHAAIQRATRLQQQSQITLNNKHQHLPIKDQGNDIMACLK